MEGEREREKKWNRPVRHWARRLLQRGQSASSSMPATPMGNGNVPTNAPPSSNDERPKVFALTTTLIVCHPWPDDGPASGRRRRSSSVRHFFDTGRRQIGPFWPAAADHPTTSGQQVRRKTRWQKKMTIGLVIAIRARSASTTARPDAGSFWAATTTTTVCVCQGAYWPWIEGRLSRQSDRITGRLLRRLGFSRE